MPFKTNQNGAPGRLRPRRAWAPVVVLLAALAGTGAVTAFVSRTVAERNEMRFDDAVDATLRDISERIEGYIDALHAGTALFAAQRQVERVEFASFVDGLDLERRHPGVRGIGWAPLVERDQRDALVLRAKAEGFENFRIWPATDASVAQPILYLEPLDSRNQAAIGFDMFSEPERRAAMERARDTGEATASAKIRLVQEIDADLQPGFLIYVPVYAGNPANVEERRASLRGFVYSPFRSRDMLKGIFGSDVLGNVSFRIYDGPSAERRKLLYESAADAHNLREPSLEAQRALFLAGRTWTVGLETTHLFRDQAQEHVAPLVLLSGLALSLLLAAVTWLETRARAHSERARAALQRSKDAMARANRIKDEFLAMLGHELRNPLGALANAIRVLRLRAPDDPPVQRSLDAAERQLRVQTRLVDDLLDVSRLSTGKIRLVRQKVDIGEVARRAVGDARALAKERGQRLALSHLEDVLVVDGDPVRLEQILSNLLGNAIKYTPPGGDISVVVALEGQQVVVRVCDTGMGIAPEALRNIFELFTQTDVAKARTQGGLGIGLTLVRQLTELHGGSVEAHSAGIDRGSEFVVRLPAVEGPAEPMEPSSGPLEVIPQRPELGAQQVLVVEDNPDARQMLADLLTLLGHEVRTAEDGERGIEAALRNPPQLMFVDLGLPKVNGYEVARRLRQTPLGSHLYLVALTGYGQPEDRDRAIEAGFDEHLVKPLDIECLKQALERAWRRETSHAVERHRGTG